jgi:hypothetical protein
LEEKIMANFFEKFLFIISATLLCGLAFAGDPYEAVRESREYGEGYAGDGFKNMLRGAFLFFMNLLIFCGWLVFEKKGKMVLYGSLLGGFFVLLTLSDNPEKYLELSRIFKTLPASLFTGLVIFFTYALFSGFYVKKEKISQPDEIKIDIEKNKVPGKIENLDIKKSCILIIINQWIGGPYWVRAFPAEEVVKKLRRTNINEPNMSKIVDIINSMGDYKFNLIDELIDSGIEVVAESIDTSRVRAIRATRVSAKEKGWSIVLSEFDTVTKV